jgi:hypothetical protein
VGPEHVVATQAGDQHVRRLERRMAAVDGVPAPPHHVLVVTVDDTPADAVAEGDQRHGGRFGRRVRVRVLVVTPRR